MAAARPAFPVGLYATLLLALCWLVLPELLRPVERFLLGVACLPQRWFGTAGAEPAFAAGPTTLARLQELQRSLDARARDHDFGRGRAAVQNLEPLSCRVRAVTRRGSGGDYFKGGGDVPCELLLDRSYDELAGCVDFVTCGDVLLGFLARPGIGAAKTDAPTDPARVLLLNHPQSREVAARIELADAEDLHCVVGPAAKVDPAPLRTTLHDDPYRAASLRTGDAPVRTLALDAAWIGAVPAGLLLGHTRIWGYDTGGDTLTIGLYAAPPLDPRELPQVVLWQSVAGVAAPRPEAVRAFARAVALPDGTGGRWLLSATTALPDGAAVVRDGVCLGLVRGIAFGQGLCTSFAASRHPWSLWLLPDDPELPPQGLFGEVVYADAANAWFHPRVGAPRQVAGFVFTGSNGPHCPPGLLLGHAEPDAARQLLRIAVPERSAGRQVEVVVGDR